VHVTLLDSLLQVFLETLQCRRTLEELSDELAPCLLLLSWRTLRLDDLTDQLCTCAVEVGIVVFNWGR
jgi:hypothetical protein